MPIQLSLLDGAAAPEADPSGQGGDVEQGQENEGAESVEGREGRRRAGGLRLVSAAYAPDNGRPICPSCWSSPEVKRYTRGIRGAPRGWGTASAGESEMVAGTAVAVIETIYRCSNPECERAIALRMLVTGGYVPSLVNSRRLSGVDAGRFRAGTVRRDGIWLAPDGRPRTAGAQMGFSLGEG